MYPQIPATALISSAMHLVAHPPKFSAHPPPKKNPSMPCV